MADVINLKRERKKRKRDKKEQDSAIRRVEFGTSKKDKAVIDFARERDEQHLDNHKLEKPSKDDE